MCLPRCLQELCRTKWYPGDGGGHPRWLAAPLFFYSRRRHTRFGCDWSSDVCSSDLRGDPTWSERCFSVDTLAPGACDSAFTAIDAIADSVRARGIRRITGKLVGDGSYFEPTLIH